MFIFKMAWRDSRRNRARLVLFISSIVLGIAAITAVRSFTENLVGDIDREAKTLLGADLAIDGNLPAPDSLLAPFRIAGSDMASITNFVSMVRFPKNEGTRLAQVRVLEGNFPFFGKWKSAPEDSWLTFRTGQTALVDHALMLQFGIQPGDSIQIGRVMFKIEGDLLSSPGRSGVASSIAPVVFIPQRWLDSTGLVQKGSRVEYQYFFKFPDGTDVAKLVEPQKEKLEAAKLDEDTVEQRKRGIGRAFGNFGTFLNLVGFIALLLGCIGVAGAVHIYIKDKLPTVAVLRCLGASGRKAFYVYLVQVAGIGLLGAVAGATLGSLLQKLLPMVMKDLLPIENISSDISWTAAGRGILVGLSVAVLFALLPLSGILRTSPLRTLRADFGEHEVDNRGLRWLIYILILLSIFGFTWSILGDWRETLNFMGGVAVAFALLFALAKAMTFFLKKFFPKSWSYVWRQGIANLFRPENQTVLMVITVGLGTMLLSTLFLIQGLLLKQVSFAGSGSQPNMVLFDIQNDQKEGVAELARAEGMPLIQQVPVVTMRLESIDGKTKADYRAERKAEMKADSIAQAAADSSGNRPTEDERRRRRGGGWIWDHEFRVTFRDTLTDAEELVQGEWQGQNTATAGQPVKISLSENLLDDMGIHLGSKIVFDVQGARIETEVASIRKVNLGKIQPSFQVLFPTGVLERAPQFHVVVSRVGSAEQSAAFQSKLVKKYPNVSAIDLTQILKSVDEVLTKISFVIRFMAMFAILTGLMVLISSIYQGKYARVRESVLLRTLGASRRQILKINALEYLLLGSLACLGGLILSVAGAWALCHFVFEMPFEPDLRPLVLIFLVIVGLTVLIGLFNSREVVRKPPLEVLRAEV